MAFTIYILDDFRVKLEAKTWEDAKKQAMYLFENSGEPIGIWESDYEEILAIVHKGYHEKVVILLTESGWMYNKKNFKLNYEAQI